MSIFTPKINNLRLYITPSDKKKPAEEPVESKYESPQEQEESELKQEQLDSTTNDHAQNTPAMGKIIDKKELTLADF